MYLSYVFSTSKKLKATVAHEKCDDEIYYNTCNNYDNYLLKWLLLVWTYLSVIEACIFDLLDKMVVFAELTFQSSL
jgi:hypothetical protein